MSSQITIPYRYHELLVVLQQLVESQGAVAWLAGGFLRDVLLGSAGDDIDLVVDGPAIELARSLAGATGGAFVQLDQATDTARVVWNRPDGAALELDLTGLRAPTIQDDLRLHDLTINALALPLDRAVTGEAGSDELLDPGGGLSDLEAGVLRPCSPGVFAADPLRTLRVARLGARLGFETLPETDELIRASAPAITAVAAERVCEELWKLLATPRAAPWLAYLDGVGLLTRVLPELEAARDCTQPSEHFLPVLEHLLETVAAAEWLYERLSAVAGRAVPQPIQEARPFALPAALRAVPYLPAALPFAERLVARLDETDGGHPRLALWKLAALLHDAGKPGTKEQSGERTTFYGHEALGARLASEALARLRFPKDALAYVRLLVAEHMRPGQLRGLGAGLTERAMFRLLRDAGAASPELLLLAMCDHMAVRGPMLEWDWWIHQLGWTGALLEQFWSERRAAHERKLIGGDDVLALGVPGGPQIGRVLAVVREAQDAGEVRTREEALALAAQLSMSNEQ